MIQSVFGCEESVRREKNVRKSVKRDLRNRIDLMYYLVQDRKKRNREERGIIICKSTNMPLNKKGLTNKFDFLFDFN